MQKSLIATFAAIGMLTALPSIAEGISASLDGVSLALAGANGHLLVLQDMPDLSVRLAFATTH